MYTNRALALFTLFAAGGCTLLARKSAPPAPPPPAATRPAPPPAPAAAFVAPNLQHTRAELQGQVETETSGYAKKSELAASLDGYQPFEVSVTRGQCYKVALLLDEGVEWSEHAKKSVTFRVLVDGQPPRTFATAYGPGGVIDMGCPNEAALAKLDILAEWGAGRDKSRVHELGSGGIKAVVYTKKISDADLARRNEQIREARARELERDADFQRREAARKEQDAIDKAARDREWERRKTTGGPACKQQCSSSYSSCVSRCGSNSMCRGNCQTSEWKCKDGCR
jgi:hypothetical protein